MRRSARLLGIHRITVSRKLKFLALQARLSQSRLLSDQFLYSHIQFDEMETFEHTKLKPLSIALAVNSERKILAFEVSSMPAKGNLSSKSRKKYGFRKDGRKKALSSLFHSLKKCTDPKALFESDQNPFYPGVLKRHFPQAIHNTVKGKRGCIVGQGELKKINWDPLFKLNHTAAMLRANMSRLIRKTWCTTKLASALCDHIAIYADYHNEVLTA
jgi:hypothetical protein